MPSRLLLRSALAALLFLVAGRAAEAQTGVSLGLMGGAALPQGDLSDTHDTGWHAQAVLGLRFPVSPIGVRVEGLYASFGAKDDGVDDATALGLGAALTFDLAVPVVRPYLIGGLGYYRSEIEDDSNELGWNAGAGARLSIPGLGVTPFVEARYFSIDAPGDARIEFVPITIGLAF